MSEKIYNAIYEILKQNKKGALITIVDTKGSTPRKAGTKMFITEDGDSFGTIGGGNFETAMIKEALNFIHKNKFLTSKSPKGISNVLIKEFDLSALDKNEFDMHCGGKMKVLIEPITSSPKAIIFGGGHISITLVKILKLLEFHITVLDDRKKYANKNRFPEVDKVIAGNFERQFSKLKVDDNTYLIIVTRAHSQDQTCLQFALQTKPKYIGMIGSKMKWEGIKKNLIKKGIKKKEFERVHCPIGLSINAQTPEEIAISICAEIIKIKYS